MTRKDLKDIIARVVVRLEEKTPTPACIFGDDPCKDDPCDITTYYGVGEEG